MRSLIVMAFLAAIPGTLARSLSLAERGHGDSSSNNIVQVLYRWEKNGAHTEGIMALDSSGSVLSSSWSGKLDAGSFAKFPIAISVTDPSSASGTISVSGKSYVLRSDATDTVAPDCARIHTDGFVEIDCLIHMGDGFKPEQDASGAADRIDLGAEVITKQLNSELGVSGAAPNDTATKRAIPICETTASTNLVGNGNPHQNFYNEQLTENSACGTTTCHAGVTQTETTTYGYSVNINIAQWISGGFSVSTSTAAAANYNCDGGPGDTVCVWYHAAYTAYTVLNTVKSCCYPGTCITNRQQEGVLKSPNTNNVGGYFYCVNGARYCRSIHAGYWDDSGRAGGP